MGQTRQREQPRTIVGIDLGTTHSVVAFADCSGVADEAGDDDGPRRAAVAPPIYEWAVPQLVAPGEWEARALFPSVRYQPRAGELNAADLALPWAHESDPAPVHGIFAQTLGKKSASQLVTSAKSWLCHSAVDRHAPILPWGGATDITKVSPVAASAGYLSHLRNGWNIAHPDQPLEDQEVLLTVPASFQEEARALTLEAAQAAGLERLRLVEEPQAAFYNWLDQFRVSGDAARGGGGTAHDGSLEDVLASCRLALVVDAGGGTTDLTLIRVELRPTGPRLTRIAVGEHLLLGGDNMDLAVAKVAETKLAGAQQLTSPEWSHLLQSARQVKEALLGDGAPDSLSLTVLGRGSGLVAASQSTTLQRADVEALILDGFFPECPPSARPKTPESALTAFGLPYATDAAITRHIASFLQRHDALARDALGPAAPAPGTLPVPDALLLNGGVFRSPVIRARLLSVLTAWRGSPPTLLVGSDPERAVARGAVAYGLARRGLGLRIGGGSPRSYFLVLSDADDTQERTHSATTLTPPTREGVCVLPRGAEEGEEITLTGRRFALRTGTPVRFSLMSSTQEVRHVAPGARVVLAGDHYHALPPMIAIVDGAAQSTSPQGGHAIPVHLTAALTEVGTLELHLADANDTSAAVHATPKRWKLAFQLRGPGHAGLATEHVGQLHPRFAEATAQIDAVFGKSKQSVPAKMVKTLRGELETILGAREHWDPPLLRELFGSLLKGKARRRRSADHERVWFNLAGFALRPGHGYPLDGWRVEQLFELFHEGVQFMPEAQNQAEWWILWRRVAGGLRDDQQAALWASLEPTLVATGPRDGSRFRHSAHLRAPSGSRAAARKWLPSDSMVRLAGSLERISPAAKLALGHWLLARVREEPGATHCWWALGRLGARVPFYGSAHQVVPCDAAETWLAACMEQDWRQRPEASLAAMLLARASGDRARDLPEALREQVVARLRASAAPAGWVTLVQSPRDLAPQEARRVFGESLPPGLALLD